MNLFDREKKEEEERKRLGIEKLPSDDEDVLDGDPFKRVDINKLNEKVCSFEIIMILCSFAFKAFKLKIIWKHLM